MNKYEKLVEKIEQQREEINILHNDISQLNVKLSLLFKLVNGKETLNNEIKLNNKVELNKGKITRNAYKSILAHELRKSGYELEMPLTRQQPYIIVNNNIKIHHVVSTGIKNHLFPVNLTKKTPDDYDYLAIGCIDEDNKCNTLILPSSLLKYMLSFATTNRFAIRQYHGEFFNHSTGEKLNLKYNNFILN